MINITKPRKANQSKILQKNSAEQKRKNKTKTKETFKPKQTSLANILAQFNDPLVGVDDPGQINLDIKVVEQCQITSIAVCQLLSSLQSLLNNRRNLKSDSTVLTPSCSKEEHDQLAISVIKCLSQLNCLLSNSSESSITSFPETITLAALSIAFLLINYFLVKFESNVSNDTTLLSAIDLYFKFFKTTKCEITINDLMEQSSNDELLLRKSVDEILSNKLTDSTIGFRDVALMSGFLNCSQMVDKLFLSQDRDELYKKIFFNIHRFCLAKLNHEFHVYRLLNQYLKILQENFNFFNSKNNDEFLKTKQFVCNEICVKTLPIVDTNLESPVPGVGSLIKQTYVYLLKLIKFCFKIDYEDLKVCELQTFFLEQFVDSLNLPYSCKAKYRKLLTLLQTLPTEEINLNSINQIILKKLFPQVSLRTTTLKLYQIPFVFDPNFGNKLIENLSINSLSTSIGDFYKSFIQSLVECFRNDDEGSVEITKIWSQYWLDSIVKIFHDSNQISAITVVQNQLSAHILPVTIQNVPKSMEILFKSIGDRCLYGQITVLRIFLEKFSSSSSFSVVAFLAPLPWIKLALIDSDDMTRSEALALLIDEKFIPKSADSRILVCRFVLCFITTNLNIDNATFRQSIISKLERFYAKIINSICDRYSKYFGSDDGSNSQPTEPITISYNDLEILQFLQQTFETLIISLLPGSSFQRKYTSLNILSFLMKIMEIKNYGQIIQTLFDQLPDCSSTDIIGAIENYLLYALIDKDDKIRRLTNEILIQYRKSNWFQYTLSGQSDLSRLPISNQIYNISIRFLQSPRHQESHIGGLLQKYLLRCCDLLVFTGFDHRGISLIQHLIRNARTLFYSEKFRTNLLLSSRSDPLHGWILSLNHCLAFDSFYDGLVRFCPKSSDSVTDVEQFLALLQQPLQTDYRAQVFEPCILLSLDCLDYFLKLLTPKQQQPDSFSYQLDEDLEDNFASPSFLEMCESIQEIIEKSNTITESQSKEDIFLSNNFQLILSMCWLNLKENCFLLTTVTALFADILCMVNDNYFVHDGQSEQSPNIEPFLLISPKELYQIGMKIVTVMLKCRHKGVIEASGVSLTKFIRTQLRIQFYLSTMFNSRHRTYEHAEVCRAYRTSFESFIGDIIDNIINCREGGSSSSVTRRSAGLALIVQAILVGEAEAIYQDGIEPLEQKDDGGGNIYHRIISLLVSIAKSPIESNSVVGDIDKQQQQMDLPQANALHVLQSIIGTSALSHLTTKTVEQLFPLCVEGFNSPEWQIRNASLQLFGSCIGRMLGQKKRTKTGPPSPGESDSSLLEQFGCTIMIEEFSARYPALLDVIVGQFDSCIRQDTLNPKLLHPELVPILSLLALFAPTGTGSNRSSNLPIIQTKLKQNLVRFLSNRIWKIRMLASKSLSNLLTIEQFEKFIVEQLDSDRSHSLNYLHGLLCCVENLLELSGPNQNRSIKESLLGKLKNHLQTKQCPILDKIFLELFQKSDNQELVDNCDEPDEDILKKANENENDLLQSYFKRLSQKETRLIDKSSLNPEDRFKMIQSIVDAQHCSDIDSIHFKMMMQIRQNVSFKKSDDIRYRAACQLFEIVNSTILVDQLLLDDCFLLPFVEIMLVLLEDEERQIRVVAQKIVTIIFDQRKTNSLEHNFLSQSIAIDCFFEWIVKFSQKFTEKCFSLIEFLQFRLLNSAIDYMENYEKNILSLSDNIDDDLILFEKEEKNVFAEPFLLATKIGHCLERLISKEKPNCSNPSVTESYLISKLDQLLPILPVTSKNRITFKQQFYLSIWKLPKFISTLTSVYFGLKSLDSKKYSTFLMEMEKWFCFLHSFRLRMSSPGIELIEMRM